MHDSASLAKRADVEFLEIFKLKVKKDGATDVVDQEFLHHGGFKTSFGHPISNLSRSPISNLSFIKLSDSNIERSEGTGALL